jgi:hypothetical protein
LGTPPNGELWRVTPKGSKNPQKCSENGTEAWMGSWRSFDRNRKLTGDLTEQTLAAISSEYGKLIYLASLRDLASGIYRHEGLEALYSAGSVQEALVQAHREVCSRIMEMPLAMQETDLLRCWEGFDVEAEGLIGNWKESEAYRTLMPFGLPDYMRTLFCSNIETLLSVFESDRATTQLVS